jgi:hypothetical protein
LQASAVAWLAPSAPRGQRSPHLFTRENIMMGVDSSKYLNNLIEQAAPKDRGV